jgi:hypothetical protein
MFVGKARSLHYAGLLTVMIIINIDLNLARVYLEIFLAGNLLAGNFWRKNFSGKFLAGNIWQEIFWREIFGVNILAGTFLARFS